MAAGLRFDRGGGKDAGTFEDWTCSYSVCELARLGNGNRMHSDEFTVLKYQTCKK